MRAMLFCLVAAAAHLPMVILSQDTSVPADSPVEPPPAEDESDPPTNPILEALMDGKVHFNLRLRSQFADAEGFRGSQAYTSRLRLGYTTATYRGLTLHIDFEDIRTPSENLYNSGVNNRQSDRTTIADPPDVDLNQLYANYELDKAKTRVRGGRQRIIFDDARFIGNVGWRQNEQTFEGGLVENDWIENLNLQYAYVSKALRIFGDEFSIGNPSAARDFDSDSHLINISYLVSEMLDLVAFAYILDLKGGDNVTGASNSSNSYGLRATGKLFENADLSILYALSYAHQVENAANPTNYGANYFFAEARTVVDTVAFIGGYEHLGSDSGRNQFRTPLATAHKFNGWADAFLDNGGPQGLQDFYLGVSASLPWKFGGQVFYHKFNKADGGGDLGWEFDVLLTRPILEHMKGLVKYAYFEGREDADIWRLTFALEVFF